MSQTNIDDYLKQLNGKQILFCPFSGNAGDALISLAAYQKFADHNITYKLLLPDTEVTSDSILVFNGGGHLYAKYHNNSALLEKYGKFCRIIVLPQSVSGHQDTFHALGDNVDIICREPVSYDYLTGLGTQAKVLLTDDLALSLDANRLIEESTILTQKSNILPLKKRLRAKIKLTKKTLLYETACRRLADFSIKNELNVFRMDDESLGTNEDRPSLDVSLLFAYRPDQMTLPDAELTSFELLRFLNRYDTVNTDRLHVCIGSLLLGKTVHFYPNNYFKNESIYSFSLKERFGDNLVWHGN